jgi:hypothetical protein
LTRQRILVLGNGNSANDIAAHAAEPGIATLPVYRSIRHSSYFASVPDPERIHDIASVTRFEVQASRGGKVTATLADGTVIEDIDLVVAATGYRYSVPAIRVPHAEQEKQEEVTTPDGRRMAGLYRHLFHARHPTLAFIGYAITWVPFIMSEAQACVIARAFSGRLALPSSDVMALDEAKCVKQVGDHYKFHVLALYPGGDAAYGEELRKWALQAEGGEGVVGVEWDERRKWLLNNNVRLKTLQLVRERGAAQRCKL